MTMEVNVNVAPDARQWQAVADKFGAGLAKTLAGVGRASGAVASGVGGDAGTAKVGTQIERLVRAFPGGGMMADVGKAFKAGGPVVGMFAGLNTVIGFFKGALSQSKIFTAVSGTFFKIVGVMIDMMLMPLLPVFMRFLQWFMTRGIQWATGMGQKIETIVSRLIKYGSAVDGFMKKIGGWEKYLYGIAITWFTLWTVSKVMSAANSRMGRAGGRFLKGKFGGGNTFKTTSSRTGQTVTRYKAGTQIGGRNVGGRTVQQGGKQAVKRGGAMAVARIGTSFLAKRGTSMMAGAAIGGTVGLAGMGVGAIPGALIGAIAGLVIGQATGVAIDMATGKEVTAKRALVPGYSAYQDINETFFSKVTDDMYDNNKIVAAATDREGQKIERAVTNATKETILSSSIPDTMDAYIGVYEKMAKEADMTKITVDGETGGLMSTIGDFFLGWGVRIKDALQGAWDTISEKLSSIVISIKDTVVDSVKNVLGLGETEEEKAFNEAVDDASKGAHVLPNELWGNNPINEAGVASAEITAYQGKPASFVSPLDLVEEDFPTRFLPGGSGSGGGDQEYLGGHQSGKDHAPSRFSAPFEFNEEDFPNAMSNEGAEDKKIRAAALAKAEQQRIDDLAAMHVQFEGFDLDVTGGGGGDFIKKDADRRAISIQKTKGIDDIFADMAVNAAESNAKNKGAPVPWDVSPEATVEIDRLVKKASQGTFMKTYDSDPMLEPHITAAANNYAPSARPIPLPAPQFDRYIPTPKRYIPDNSWMDDPYDFPAVAAQKKKKERDRISKVHKTLPQQFSGFGGYDSENFNFFASGGSVPGPKGSPQLGLLHGGETVLPTHLDKGWLTSTKGGKLASGIGGDGGTVNMMNKPTTINIYTTENAVQTIENIERMQMMDEASFFTAV